VCVGYNACGQETGSNKLYIDNSNTTTPLIGGDFSANTVTITGALSAIGVVDFGGATSTEVVNGTAPTVDAAGEIAVDTTDDQLIYFSTAKRVIPYERTVCVTKDTLASTDDNMPIYMFGDAATITAVGCSYIGTGTTPATITLEDGGGNGMTITGTNPTCVAHGTNATFAAVTAGNGVVAGEVVRFDTTNTPDPTTDKYTICVAYTVDAQ
jgi:hypothetical protein